MFVNTGYQIGAKDICSKSHQESSAELCNHQNSKNKNYAKIKRYKYLDCFTNSESETPNCSA